VEAGLSIDTSAFEQMLEVVPDGIVVVGRDGRVVLVNRQTEALSGYSRQELIGMPVEELVPEPLRTQHVRNRAVYDGARAVRAMGTHLQIQLRRRDGSECPVDIALSPLTLGRVELVVASVRDITEQKQADAGLLQERDRLRLVVDNVRDYAIFMLDPEGNVSSWSIGAERIKGYQRGQIVGRHFSVFYTASDIAAGKPARALADAAATGRHAEEGWRIRRDGSRFWASTVVTAQFDESGQLTGFTKITRDDTERHLLDGRTRAALEVAQVTLEGREESALLRLISERARALVEADLVTVALFDLDGTALVIRAADGVRAGQEEGRSIPFTGTVMAGLLTTGRPFLLGDLTEAPPEARPGLTAEGVGSLMLVRLASGDRPLGVLTASNAPGGRRFTRSDLELVELFAAQTAVAIDYARARKHLGRLAVLEDRERIGRELHDGAIQALFAVGMGLQGMAMAADPSLRQRLEGSVTEIDEVIRDLRNYIFGLRPGLTADRALSDSLEALAAQFEGQHGVVCAVEVDPGPASRLAGHAADVVQIAREALSNVGRHAGARTCRLTLRAEAGVAIMEIEDDGRGFVLEERIDAGWGLRNLAERARSMGGSLDIGSAPGRGTRVRLRIPL
jgi:PAS domain S-box-containing protein